MAADMTDCCESSADCDNLTTTTYSLPSLQLDFSFLSSHDASRDNHVPALFSTTLPDDIPSLDLVGDIAMDNIQPRGDQVAPVPRKRMRGERIVWTPEEDEHLRKAVRIYGDKTEKWAKIAACVPGRTNKNCRKRWFHSLDPRLKKGGWTEEEDHLLRTGVQKFRGQWSKIAERIQGRTDDQCAKRWRESLDPDIDRAAWTPDEDLLLLKKFEEHGTQWQKIALSFPGRPGLHCRNRWRKIQRSLNHMDRTNKRRRYQLDIMDGQSGTSTLTEGQDSGARSSSEDALLQDSFLNDAYDLLEDSYCDLTDERSDTNTDEERPYGCAIPDCKFESSSPSLLYYHVKASHHGTTTLKPFRCTVSGCEDRKRYKNINGLQYHVTHAKNTPGHSGHGNNTLQENQRASTTSPPTDKAEDPAVPIAPNTLGSMAASVTNPPVSNSPPSLHSPAEIQSIISPFVPQPLVTRQAFNIPHTPESLKESLMPSPNMAIDRPTPQGTSTSLRCPELGCGQAFYALSRLTAHMANNHGHQSMIMESDDSAFGPDSIVIPQNNFDMDLDLDLDLDLAFIASESTSPMDAHMLLMDDSQQLQSQLDDLTAEHAALFFDLETSSNPQQDLDIVSINKLLFANYITHSLNNIGPYSNRVHFGTHINVSANDPLTLPSTPFTSANVSPQLKAINIPVGKGIVAPAKSSPPAVPVTAVKRFPCLATDCLRSYASNSAMRAHLRNEHPDVYVKTSKATNSTTSSTTTKATSCPSVQVSGTHLNNPAIVFSPSLQLPSVLAATPGLVSISPFSSTPSAVPIMPASVSHSKQPLRQISKKSEDPSGKPFKCLVPECGKGYTNISGLKNHLLQAHGSTPKKNVVSTSTAAITPIIISDTTVVASS